jgi:hypothetical protein
VATLYRISSMYAHDRTDELFGALMGDCSRACARYGHPSAVTTKRLVRVLAVTRR